MQYIDEKFKDRNPKETVENIQGILDGLGLVCSEHWNDSGIENCHSVNLSLQGAFTNGKGVTKDLARASAYAEMAERLQSGLFLCGYQSIIRDSRMNFHTFAPDARYMTKEELIQESEWMDYIIDSYKEFKITRENIAMACMAAACADDGKILTIPFYSLFEDKYVYFPAAFVASMYTANGNCAGNTKEEAWVHALSEIMERNASQRVIVKGEAMPQIPEEVLQKFPTISNIIKQIRENGDFDIAVFDYSLGNGFPVVATRVINKKDQTYLVNVAADPVLEIAIQRTFTELFQGRCVTKLSPVHDSKILSKNTDFPIYDNVANHLHTSDGLYTADYFANELTCNRRPSKFADNSNKTNKELLEYLLGLYKEMGKPIYVRNYSFLGFASYKLIVPGFSETRAFRLGEIIPDNAIGDSVREVFKNPLKATDDDLTLMLIYSDSTKNMYGRFNSFAVNSGIPIKGRANFALCHLTRAYANYRLGKYRNAIVYGAACIPRSGEDDETRAYFTCVNKYLEMKVDGISEEKIRAILYKFFIKKYPDELYAKLDNGKTPYDDYVLRCEIENCDECRYKDCCSYHDLRKLVKTIGEKYKVFEDGQDPSNFVY